MRLAESRDLERQRLSLDEAELAVDPSVARANGGTASTGS
jgi:hypothetical protein